MKRVHLMAAWLAVAALLIDGLLPTAVSAAALPDRAAPFALCGAPGGNSFPEHVPSPLPAHHCALCAVCAGWTLGLLPNRAEGLSATTRAATALPALSRTAVAWDRRGVHTTAQPRAPPERIS